MSKAANVPAGEIPIPVSSTVKIACVSVCSTRIVMDPTNVSISSESRMADEFTVRRGHALELTLERISDKIENDLLPETKP